MRKTDRESGKGGGSEKKKEKEGHNVLACCGLLQYTL